MNRSSYAAQLAGMIAALLFALPVLAEVYTPPPPIPSDMRPVPKPEYRSAPDDFATAIDYEFIQGIKNSLNPSRVWRRVTGNRKQAMNVDAFDRMADNSWWTNRMGFVELTPEQLARGPLSGDGPATDGPWIIKRAKAEGVTPGFHIKDARGDRYVIKFDPIGYGGLNSGADAMGAKFFWAAGYNAPENYIAYFDPAILTLDPEGVTFTDSEGEKRLMTEADLEDVLTRVNVNPDGRIQCLASKYIEGELLGPFKFRKTREDDQNDFVRHEHRRELRGQKAIAVWINHYDSKGANSMDAYVGEDGEGHVVHYMMDFGTTFGSGGRGPYPFYRGYEDEMDVGATLRRISSFGLYVKDYEKPDSVYHNSVGRFRNTDLDPHNYRTVWPNPAYQMATRLDLFWGARIVTAFSEDHIRAIVETGPYSLEAVDFLVDTLVARRDIVGRTFFSDVNCLDDFVLPGDGTQGRMEFTDLWLDRGYGDTAEYRVIYRDEDGNLLGQKTINTARVPLGISPANLGQHRQLHVTLAALRDGSEEYGPEITVYLEHDPAADRWVLLGLNRHD